MSRRVSGVAATIALGLLTACASPAPPRYYTLLPSALDPGEQKPDRGFAFEVLPVSVPEQVNIPQLVIRRRGDGELVPVETRQWVAPLAHELRAALAEQLRRALQVPEVRALPQVPGLAVYRIRVDVGRFDSVPGSAALIEATWSVSGPDRADTPVICSSRARETVSQDYAALVQGYQRAVAGIAAQIAAVVEQWQAGGVRVRGCPTLASADR